MTETIAYIRQSLKDIYSSGEIQAFTRLIMERICGLSTSQFLANKGNELSDKEKFQIKEIISGLQEHKPIQYLLGVEEFLGLDFKVTPGVLIPRPETAELANLIISDFKDQNPQIVDIGTGSGCIAIALAKYLPKAIVSAIDVSPEAIAIAKKNAQTNHVSVSFINLDILSNNIDKELCETDVNPNQLLYDCIVSNPPYIMEKEKSSMDDNVLKNEPALALFVPDDDPLLFYKAISKFGRSHLKTNGKIYFEINALCGKETMDLLQKDGYTHIELIQDFYSKNRIIKAIK